MRENTFLVLGAGLMGRALALDLARSERSSTIVVADVDESRAGDVARSLPNGKGKHLALDVGDYNDVVRAMKDAVCTVGAVSYKVNVDLTRAAIEAGCSYCDLGGNDSIVEQQLSLDESAHRANVTIIPNCGLAPGLANIIAAKGSDDMSDIQSIRIRVGGLPVHPTPPLNYQLVFSVEGLINEYSGDALVLRDGAVTKIPSLTEVESLNFLPRFPELEAFLTSGGTSLLPKMLQGRVAELDYKTIRYPGHCEKMRTLLELGFGSLDPIQVGRSIMTQRELFGQLLLKRIPSAGPDVVLVRVEIEGKTGIPIRRVFELIDFADETDNISAMMRTTAYPTSVIAQLVQQGIVTKRGVSTPEQCVPLEPLLEGLRRRGVIVTKKEHETTQR